MAPLKLTIRTSPQDAFSLDFEDEETAEALSVAIFSLRPELGEELRLAHKGRPLRDEQELAAAGVRSGDVIAVAKRPPKAAAAAEPAAPAEAVPVAVEPIVAAAVPAPAEAAPAAAEPAAVAAEPVPMAAPPMPPPLEAPAEEAAVPAEEAACPAAAVPPIEVPADEPAEQPAASPSRRTEPQEVNSDALFAMAWRLESGESDAHPAELVAFLRKAATRMQNLEGAVGEAGQALQLFNHLSAHALQSIGNTVQGLPTKSEEREREESGTKSFLVKRGDADLQEAHRAAASMQRQTSGGTPNSHSGGVLSSSATPMSKEEMDKARRARLEKLEQQQAEKVRAQEEANARSKAKESLFEKPFAGSAKPLGKF